MMNGANMSNPAIKEYFNIVDRPIDEKFKIVFKDYERQIQEKVLYDILCRFRFADWTRECDYSKMTSKEVMEAAMSVCDDIEKDWDYNLDDDIMPMYGSMSFDF